MRKDELVKTIQVKHRQLMRYLFYFEKNRQGEFVAGERPKFGLAEMQQPGVYGDWSLKDLLSQLIYWEQYLLRLCRSESKSETGQALPSPTLRWDEIVPLDAPVFDGFHSLPLQNILQETKDTYVRIISTVESLSSDALFMPGTYAWAGQASLADYVALFTYRQYDWIKGLVRRWRKSHAGEYLDKKIILNRIQTERRRLEQILDQVSHDQMSRTKVLGEWSIKDILAHLMDWEQRFIGWYQAGIRGEVPEIPAPGIGWEQLDILNQQIYKKHRARSIEDVLRDFHESYNQILSIVEGISEEEMFAIGRYAWLGESSMVDVILGNTANHYQWAKQHIRKWMQSQGKL